MFATAAGTELSASASTMVQVNQDSGSLSCLESLFAHDGLSLSSLKVWPKLIVFDLDNTLWTPELYQIRQRQVPKVNRDIRLFDAAQTILEFFARHQQRNNNNSNNNNSSNSNINHQSFCLPQLALASRTTKRDWAEQLLDDFTIRVDSEHCNRNAVVSMRSLFDYIEIQPGSKKLHFAKLRQASGYRYDEMLFIDDDERMNLKEVSQQLGVLCCHTPTGITLPHFIQSLQKYSDLKNRKDNNNNNNQHYTRPSSSSSLWMGYILNSQNLNIPVLPKQEQQPQQVLQGRVKFYSPQKRFGFVVDMKSNQEFFVHESKVPTGMKLQTGDQVTFEAIIPQHLSSSASLGGARGEGRLAAVILSNHGAGSAGAVAVTASNKISHNKNDTVNGEAIGNTTVEMPCFSMSQPFCALLINGLKTVESRNDDMFCHVKPGTRVLVACGRKDWPDQESYRQILLQESNNEGNSNGTKNHWSMSDISKASRLSPMSGHHRPAAPLFQKGQVVGVVTIGTTRRVSRAERDQDLKLQRQVLAYGNGIGQYCTEIQSAQWLVKPLNARGQPGLYTGRIPTECLPVTTTQHMI